MGPPLMQYLTKVGKSDLVSTVSSHDSQHPMNTCRRAQIRNFFTQDIILAK